MSYYENMHENKCAYCNERSWPMYIGCETLVCKKIACIGAFDKDHPDQILKEVPFVFKSIGTTTQ